MKILVFSDIHGRVNATKKVVSLIEKIKPDHLFFLGDFLYNGPRNGVPDDYNGMEVADLLRPYLGIADFVKGNCDAKIDDTVLGVDLPSRYEGKFNSFNCVLAHGDDLDPSFLKLEKGDIFFSGHTHIHVLEKKDGIIYVNPGSTSFPKGDNIASYAYFDTEKIEIRKLSDSSVIASMNL